MIGLLGKVGSKLFRAAAKSAPVPKWMGMGDALAVGTTLATGDPMYGLGWLGASRLAMGGANYIGGKLAPRASFNQPRGYKAPKTPKTPKSRPFNLDKVARAQPTRSTAGRKVGIMKDIQKGLSPATGPTNYGIFEPAYSYGKAWQRMGKLWQGKEVDVFKRGLELEAQGAGRFKKLVSGLGSAAGASHRATYEIGKKAAQGIGAGAGFAYKHKVPIANVGLLGFSALGLMGLQDFGGNPLSLHTYSTNSDQRGQNPLFLKNQMQAIAEYQMYESSPQAGMRSAMKFGRESYDGPIPVLPSLQKAAGYSPQALGATGDLVFALNSLRRQ